MELGLTRRQAASFNVLVNLYAYVVPSAPLGNGPGIIEVISSLDTGAFAGGVLPDPLHRQVPSFTSVPAFFSPGVPSLQLGEWRQTGVTVTLEFKSDQELADCWLVEIVSSIKGEPSVWSGSWFAVSGTPARYPSTGGRNANACIAQGVKVSRPVWSTQSTKSSVVAETGRTVPKPSRGIVEI